MTHSTGNRTPCSGCVARPAACPARSVARPVMEVRSRVRRKLFPSVPNQLGVRMRKLLALAIALLPRLADRGDPRWRARSGDGARLRGRLVRAAAAHGARASRGEAHRAHERAVKPLGHMGARRWYRARSMAAAEHAGRQAIKKSASTRSLVLRSCARYRNGWTSCG
jgi:hypothetical protein